MILFRFPRKRVVVRELFASSDVETVFEEYRRLERRRYYWMGAALVSFFMFVVAAFL